MGGIAGPIRNPQTPIFTDIFDYFAIDDVEAPMLRLHCAQLGVKLAKGAKLRHVRADLDFHVHHRASIWNTSGSLRAQLQPNTAQIGPKLAWGQVGPNQRQFCVLNATR